MSGQLGHADPESLTQRTQGVTFPDNVDIAPAVSMVSNFLARPTGSGNLPALRIGADGLARSCGRAHPIADAIRGSAWVRPGRRWRRVATLGSLGRWRWRWRPFTAGYQH
ncbi:hypothetical protein [Arthrobacter bambusae]|uniref:Uncharacterized protein n=1 Tax=Arthrobacter bambusae TaxID=1338426 RepID=A0AAW8D9N1_9MICC|nr:hypothetical protein [Arthrobacter bambusae]MDP9903178.1 hypothetical protein [Arthrobacter bambusae]MDQ0128828.1 hypothetical protein [Arthrobacter bambusae]MDQ0180169.1 hypothetical protein [Arthrobacter bambusae]